ncbi:hypothetical protein L6Q21_00155 [Sandaracinobacter sp. RS1-74]|uniref:tetratricopeptide repeat protein n=1 Tax=Sandaracinobacteroides sayramensis TaxID=2913411 RepID=UPI001EDABC75|nr:hypothetical protein [Sandaracinobacteroides sayramensis]MCG2839388.1 hypothetical protein [Sandaracinobacteroides sayramensis]
MRMFSIASAAGLIALATALPASTQPAGVPVSRLLAPEAAAESTMQMGLSAFKAGDHKAAQRHFRTLASRGDPAAETLLGTMAANGQGGARDDAVAAAWFLRAARRGYAPAQLALADSFARGRGVPQDLARARTLARAAAVQGHPGAAQFAARITPERYALLAVRR